MSRPTVKGNPFSSHTTPAHDHAPAYQVWLQRLHSSEDIFCTHTHISTHRENFGDPEKDPHIKHKMAMDGSNGTANSTVSKFLIFHFSLGYQEQVGRTEGQTELN